MKKILALLLALATALSFAACGSRPSDPETTVSIPGDELNTLNKVFANGYEDAGRMISDNVYAQEVTDSNGGEYLLVVKVPAEQMDAFEAIDFLADDAGQQYLALIGDIELTDARNKADFMPGQDELDAYVGMTIAEFEMTGAEMTGYVGGDGEYAFFFDDEKCAYRVELEAGVKLEEYDDTALFDAAIQDLKIGKIECSGVNNIFWQNYIDQFLDPPEKAAPKELGDAKSSLDEINEATGADIKAAEGASDEKYSVIDGKIAQYTYQADGYFFCVRAAADTDINLADDEFKNDPLVDGDGYVTTVSSQTDTVQSLRFVFNGYQYAYMVYDNGELDYTELSARQEAYKKAVCAYREDSALNALIGNHSSDDGYIMSGAPVTDDTVQVVVYTSDGTQAKLWTMLVKENGGAISYEKSKLEIYLSSGEENPAPCDAGSGSFAVEDGTIIWDNHNFR